MTETTTDAGPTPEDVQHEMQSARAHLVEGVHALGDRAAACATDAAEAVGDAYRGTRDALHAARQGFADATAAVGRALDVRSHVRRYPWIAVGTAVALGFACGRIVGRR